MQPKEFDLIVKSVASDLSEKDVDAAAMEVDRQLDGRAWNMNQPLNMIAYEDQI